MKRITIFCGHYGSGKTNIAVNYAISLRKKANEVCLADLDIVNPYFRSKDSKALLERESVKLISSDFANTNVDIPALPSQMYAITDNKNTFAVLDIGGDDRGALALGRLSDKIKEENDYINLMVINKYRPLSDTPEKTLEIMREIEAASRLPFDGIVNNSNLGEFTDEKTVLDSFEYANKVSRLSGLPIIMTTAEIKLCEKLSGKVENLFPLKLQSKII